MSDTMPGADAPPAAAGAADAPPPTAGADARPDDATPEAATGATPETATGAAPEAATGAARQPVMPDAVEDALRLVEAVVFAAAAPVGERAITPLLPPGLDYATVIEGLRARYAGRGVDVVEVAGGLQFRTAPDLAPRLRRVVQVPRRLPRAAMETLAVIAYHQPVTRPEIEEIRGTSLAQATMDALLEQGLIAPKGRKEAPGRPTLWATTPAFLALFGLNTLRDLPRREDLLVEPPAPAVESTPVDAAAAVDVAETEPGVRTAEPPAAAAEPDAATADAAAGSPAAAEPDLQTADAAANPPAAAEPDLQTSDAAANPPPAAEAEPDPGTADAPAVPPEAAAAVGPEAPGAAAEEGGLTVRPAPP